jgi:hypothetical protein
MSEPRILGLDIETGPANVWVFQFRDANIGIDQIEEPGRVICWSAKWFGEDKIHYADERGGKKRMFRQIRKLLLEADAVVTYNGNRFDLQKIDGELLYHRIPPLPRLTSIDLWQTTNKLGYDSSKLAFLVRRLGIGEKIKNAGMPLWIGCMHGDKESWRLMQEYNIGDTTLLESAYDILRPYIKNHPHLGPPRGRTSCPRCRSTRNVVAAKPRYTKNLIIQRLECTACKGWFDGQQSRAAA